MQFVERIVESSKTWLGLLAQLFLLAGAAVSCYFVGLFLYLGLDLMVLLDKQSLIEAIFFYAAIFSVVMALATIVTAPLPKPKALPREPELPRPPVLFPLVEPLPRKRSLWSRLPLIGTALQGVEHVTQTVPEVKAGAEEMLRRWKREAKQKLRSVLPALIFSALLFVAWLLHFWRGAMFLVVMGVLLVVARLFPRFLYSSSLLVFVLLGALRADLLSYATASMLVRGTMLQETTEAVVVLASSRGILTLTSVANDPRRRPRFLPWERVASIEPSQRAPSAWSAAGVCDWMKPPPWLVRLGVGRFGFCE